MSDVVWFVLLLVAVLLVMFFAPDVADWWRRKNAELEAQIDAALERDDRWPL